MSGGDAEVGGRIHGRTQGSGEGPGEAYCAVCNNSYPMEQDTCPVDGASLVLLPEERDEMVGRILEGRFEIRERVGAGGMGTVYRGFQASVGRDVAIKVIDPVVSRDRETVKRFMREAQLASKLSHPNTVVVHDFGQTHDGVVYLVMEMIQGRTLREVIAATGPMSPALLVRLGEQMCDALHSAHSMGIIHRDLKPSNVMILDGTPGRERVKVLDFGLAKSLVQDTTEISNSRVRLGTPMYMSPEMIRAEDLTASSDLYSLGCTLYEMATGRAPFVSSRVEVLFAHHLDATPEAFGRRELADVEPTIMQLLAKQPAERPESADAVRRLLTGATDEGPTEPIPVSRTEQLGSSAERRFAVAATLDARSELPSALEARTTPRPLRSLLFGVALLIVAVGAATFYLLNRGGSSDQPVKRSVAQQPPVVEQPDAMAKTAAAPPARPAPVAEKVKLSFECKPSASVAIDGKVVGNTPITTEVDKGQVAVDVVLSRKGYVSNTFKLVPLENKSVKTALKPVRRRRSRRRSVKTEPKKIDPPVVKKADPEPKVTPPVKKTPEPPTMFRLDKRKPKK